MSVNERLEKALGMVLRELGDSKSIMNELNAITRERNDYLAMLQNFWRASNRPWFCRHCTKEGEQKKGYLLPFGRDGFRCADCETEYQPVKNG